jgi:hypothetical protein
MLAHEQLLCLTSWSEGWLLKQITSTHLAKNFTYHKEMGVINTFIMYSVLRCNTMYNWKQLPMFQRILLPEEDFDILKNLLPQGASQVLKKPAASGASEVLMKPVASRNF